MCDLKEQILNLARDIHPRLCNLSDAIYARPELGFEEHFAAKSHLELLRDEGFSIEEGICDLPTAFRATYKSDKPGPTIAYMAEYDALPGIGHGCGHNILGASSTGAAIVLRHLVDDLGGTVILLGTPAEETSGAKVTMAEAGLFADIDAALIAHPDTCYKPSGKSLALQPIAFEYFGRTAHAAADPEKGINALDAAILTFNNINALRQHIPSSARIHGIIRHGGEAANIVPEYAKSEFYVRATTKKIALELLEKVIHCAEAGALAAGATMTHYPYELAYDDMVTNETLNELFVDAIRLYSEDPIADAEGGGGSIDAGNVSHATATIHGYFPIADHPIAGHTREFAEASISDYAHEKLREIVAILAHTGARLLKEPKVLAAVRAEYDAQVASGAIIPPSSHEKSPR